MNHPIILVDAIGIHSGMRYYLDSFKDIIKRIDGIDVRVFSNYPDSDQRPFLPNFYKGSRIVKLINLSKGLIRLWFYSLFNNHSVYIILSYGTPVDALLINAVWAKRKVIDVHEVIEQGSENNQVHKILFSSIYAKQRTVIYHSERAKQMLVERGFRGELYFVPHFEYNTDSAYKLNNISKTIISSIKRDKINLLFFGNITYSKGIDIFIHSINELTDEVKEQINVIIAGKTLDDTFSKCDTTSEVFCVSIQHLNDDEMKFLYSQTDYVVLPYRQTSQSGVLEMAIHYKKPVIASDIPYFSMMLDKYPSFGIITELEQHALQSTWSKIVEEKSLLSFYKETDLKKYKTRVEDDVFVREFSAYLERM